MIAPPVAISCSTVGPFLFLTPSWSSASCMAHKLALKNSNISLPLLSRETSRDRCTERPVRGYCRPPLSKAHPKSSDAHTTRYIDASFMYPNAWLPSLRCEKNSASNATLFRGATGPGRASGPSGLIGEERSRNRLAATFARQSRVYVSLLVFQRPDSLVLHACRCLWMNSRSVFVAEAGISIS